MIKYGWILTICGCFFEWGVFRALLVIRIPSFDPRMCGWPHYHFRNSRWTPSQLQESPPQLSQAQHLDAFSCTSNSPEDSVSFTLFRLPMSRLQYLRRVAPPCVVTETLTLLSCSGSILLLTLLLLRTGDYNFKQPVGQMVCEDLWRETGTAELVSWGLYTSHPSHQV